LIFSGRRLTAEAAEAIGLVNMIAEPGGLEAAVLNLASPILSAAPIALAQAKRAIDEGLEMTLVEGLSFEESCYDVTIPTEDRLEALDAFRNKRKPVFKGS
jgi:enoyl-CoA hydratase/carnithine racemase